jgi:glycosyltransferase involved in cell wall biosynthesis
VFCPVAGDAPFGEPSLEEGVRVYRAAAGSQSRTRVFANTFGNGRLSRAFATLLEAERPDLIHVQHLMGLPVSIIDQVRGRGIPYVMTLHDYWYICANAQLLTNYDNTLSAGPDPHFHNCARCALARAGLNRLGWLAPAVAPIMARRNHLLHDVFVRANRIIAPADFVRQVYDRLGYSTERTVVVPFGVELSPADLQAARTAAAQRPATGLRIGYVGGIAWQKGLHCLIAAVNQLPHEDVTLSIYGGLSAFRVYATELRDLAKHPGIRFEGVVSRQELWPALGSLDVLVVPSLWYEGSPAIIREAFAAGVPVIASRIGALPEMVRDGVDGLLFPPGDTAALYDILHTLLDKPGELDKLRPSITPVLSFGEHVERVTAIYQEALLTS